MTPNQIELDDIILQDRYVIQYIWISGFISGESFRMDQILSRSLPNVSKHHDVTAYKALIK